MFSADHTVYRTGCTVHRGHKQTHTRDWLYNWRRTSWFKMGPNEVMHKQGDIFTKTTLKKSVRTCLFFFHIVFINEWKHLRERRVLMSRETWFSSLWLLHIDVRVTDFWPSKRSSLPTCSCLELCQPLDDKYRKERYLEHEVPLYSNEQQESHRVMRRMMKLFSGTNRGNLKINVFCSAVIAAFNKPATDSGSPSFILVNL